MHHSDDKIGARNERNGIRISVLFGFRKTIADGTRKREIARQVYLNRANLSFYCNSRKAAILNPQRTRETQFLRKLFARPAFSRKSGQFCVAYTRLIAIISGISFTSEFTTLSPLGVAVQVTSTARVCCPIYPACSATAL